MSRIIPPKDPAGPIVQTPFRVEKQILDEIDQIATEGGYSRNEILSHLVKWALAEYRLERAAETQAKQPKPKK